MISLAQWYSRRVKVLLWSTCLIASLLLGLFTVSNYLDGLSRQNFILRHSTNLVKLGILQNNRVLIENGLDSMSHLLGANWVALCQNGRAVITVNFPSGECIKVSNGIFDHILASTIEGFSEYKLFVSAPRFSTHLTYLIIISFAIALLGILAVILVRTRQVIQSELIDPLLSDWSGDLQFSIRELDSIRKTQVELEKKRRFAAVADAIVQNNRQIGHDIRSPLSALKLIAHSDRIDADQVFLLRKVVARIGEISNLLLGQRSSKDQAVPVECFELTKLLQELVNETAMSRKDESIEIEFSRLEKPIYFLGDRIAIGRIISNLLNNSCDAVRSASCKVISCELKVFGDHILISIFDRGGGIPKHVLDSFSTKPISTKLGGHGLGMQFCISKAKALGGDVSIKTDHETFSEVVLSLPNDRQLEGFSAAQ